MATNPPCHIFAAQTVHRPHDEAAEIRGGAKIQPHDGHRESVSGEQYDRTRAREVVGSYANEMMTITIATDGSALTIECAIEPEIRAATDTELP